MNLQTTQGSREDVTQTTTEPETDRTPAARVLPTETPTPGSEPASEGVGVDIRCFRISRPYVSWSDVHRRRRKTLNNG